MVISNLNTARILELTRYIESCLEEIKPYSRIGIKDFLSDKKTPPFVESYLRRSLEALFDIGRHILAKTYGFKEIEYKEIARELGKREVISQELSDVLIKMAGYRNRMVHFYKEITPEEIHQILINNLGDFDKFNKEIISFIRKYEEKKELHKT